MTEAYPIRTDSCQKLIARMYKEMYVSLCRYVEGRIGDVSDAEDLVQDAFEQILSPGRIILEKSIRKYIYVVVHGHIVDWYRHHTCSMRAQDYFFAHSPVCSEDVDARMHADDIIRLEEEALASVGRRGKDVYRMYVHEGCRIREVAELLKLSERTVENHVFRTRSLVREHIRRAI